MKFFIKKSVEAKDMMDALKRESKGRVIEVWSDNSEPISTSAIGFYTE